ncbi:MAG: hypothetical protein GY757_27290 [bacterium]|nr:hypothetical protein [bacterium]
MKKVLILVIIAFATTLFAANLHAENVNWNASSDYSCDTYFHVGSHDAPVTIMRLRVLNDLTPRPGNTWETRHTLNVNQHYVDSWECPNFKYLYKLVDANTGALVSTRTFTIRAIDSSNALCICCSEEE